jgi:hypothetical protein
MWTFYSPYDEDQIHKTLHESVIVSEFPNTKWGKMLRKGKWKHSQEWLLQKWSHLRNGMAQRLEFLLNELPLGMELLHEWLCSITGLL